MPRQSRIDAPGALHHVMIRGIERREIFQDHKDRDSFLDRLGSILLGLALLNPKSIILGRCLFNRGMPDVSWYHLFKGDRKKVEAPSNRPDWMPAKIWKPVVKKTGFEHMKKR